VNTSKTDTEFRSNLTYLRAFLVNSNLQKLFSNKLPPAEHFFFGIWPSNKSDFETPDLRKHFLYRK
jgi:hypothetical protein